MRWLISKLLLLVIIAYGVWAVLFAASYLTEKSEVRWTDYIILYVFLCLPIGAAAALRQKIYTPPPKKRPPPKRRPTVPVVPLPIEPAIPDLPEPKKRGFAPPPTVSSGSIEVAPVPASISAKMVTFVSEGEANIQAELAQQNKPQP